MNRSHKRSPLLLCCTFVLAASFPAPEVLRARPPCFPSVAIGGCSAENIGGFANGS